VLSYSLQEHGRWSVKAAVLFRIWLKDSHIKRPFIRAIKAVFTDEIRAEYDISKHETDLSAALTISSVLAAIVHSNMVLTADTISDTDRNDFHSIVYRGRRLFQLFCKSALMSSTRKKPREEQQSREQSIASDSDVSFLATAAVDIVAEDEKLSPTQRAAKYQLFSGRPNVHVGLHWEGLLDEYGLVGLTMVLAGEKKHKEYKGAVLHTNNREPERDLFALENVKQTLRLLLLQGYTTDFPIITQKVRDIDIRCPSLFSSILPENYRHDDEGDDAPITLHDLRADPKHENPTVMVRLTDMFCHQKGWPTRSNDSMTESFRSLLQQAFADDYNRNVIIATGHSLKWWKRLAFDSRFVPPNPPSSPQYQLPN
jgi:hypothetical protein